MSAKEAKSRIKINKCLEDAGWRFFDSKEGQANIALEPNVKLTQTQVDAWGNDFETSSSGFIEFLLLDANGFPLLVRQSCLLQSDSDFCEAFIYSHRQLFYTLLPAIVLF